MPVNKCNVVAPEWFVPKSDEQDIAIMAPLFDLFDEQSNRFENYSEHNIHELQQHLDWQTECFYQHVQKPITADNAVWDTLAKWRYQNTERYKAFMFWLQVHKEHVEEVKQAKMLANNQAAKLEALESLFGTKLYKHHSGKVYQFLIVGNTNAHKQDYPESVAYMDIVSREIYIRPMDQFRAKFSPLNQY